MSLYSAQSASYGKKGMVWPYSCCCLCLPGPRSVLSLSCSKQHEILRYLSLKSRGWFCGTKTTGYNFEKTILFEVELICFRKKKNWKHNYSNFFILNLKLLEILHFPHRLIISNDLSFFNGAIQSFFLSLFLPLLIV